MTALHRQAIGSAATIFVVAPAAATRQLRQQDIMASPPTPRNWRKFAVSAAMIATAGGGILSLLFASTRTASPCRHHPDGTRILRAIGGFRDPRTVLPRVPNTGVRDAGDQDTCRPEALPLWWEDIDYDADIPCGIAKCYFTSASDQGRGYLIQGAKFRFSREKSLLDAEQAYQFEKGLESDFGIRHFSTCPPFKTNTSEYFRARPAGKPRGSKSKKLSRRFGSLVIQPCRTAPEGSVLFKCTKNGPATPILNRVIERGGRGCSETLLKELADAISLLKVRPELALGWQVMVDPEGRFYHIDLQRAGKSHSARRAPLVAICLESAMAHVRDFYITG